MLCVLLASGCAATDGPADSAPKPAGPVKTRDVDAMLVEDFTNVPTLMQWSDRVFSGTVTENLGTIYAPGSTVPATLFRVRVDKWFGASAGDEVVVYQDGGYDEAEKTVYTMEEDELLSVGQQYMLAGRAGGPPGAEEAIVLVPNYGTVQTDSPKMSELVKAAEASSMGRS